MGGDAFRQGPRDDPRNGLHAGRADLGDAAETPEQFLRRARPHARDLLEPCLECTPGAPLAVESDGESVRLVADLLN